MFKNECLHKAKTPHSHFCFRATTPPRERSDAIRRLTLIPLTVGRWKIENLTNSEIYLMMELLKAQGNLMKLLKIRVPLALALRFSEYTL